MNHKIIKSITSYAILFSLMLAFATSCEMDDPVSPPGNTLSPDNISNIADLRSTFVGDTVFFEDSGLNVFATVTMDDNAGNIYREAFVQDDEAGILLRLTQFANFKEGDSVRIALKGAYLTEYAGMLQLSNLNPATNVVVQESDKHREPALTTIGDIDSSFQGKLVKIDDVQFAYGSFGVPYALSPEIQSGTNRRIQDEAGNTMIVRTSGYAEFASEHTPEGNGSIIGLVGEHFGNMQLHIRRTSEVNMEGERFETIDPDGAGTFDDPYNVAHAIAYNTGTNKWVEGYIVGVMETVTDDFHPSFEPPFQTVSNIIIADTPDESSLNNAIIVQLLPGDIRNALNLAQNPENKGKVVKVSGDLEAYFGQPGLRNTSGYWMDGEGIIIDEPEGSGTFDDPYNVAHAILYNTGDNQWVEGYITGVMETNVEPFTPSFEPPFHTNSNILIADSPTETSLDKSLIIQLPFGEVRDALNLVDNPSNKGKKVKLLGDFALYFGQPGMRNTSDYWMDGDGDDDDDDDDNGDNGAVTYIHEDFQSYPNHSVIDQNGWTAFAEEGGRNWICRTHEGNHYAQATAFNSPDATNVMWMITPPIDRDAMSNPIFEFESAKAFYTHDGFSLWISTDFDGTNVTAATWEPLEARLAEQGDPDHGWIHSGYIDLSSYQGILHIAWRYEAAEPQGKTGTFRVDNVKLYGDND